MEFITLPTTTTKTFLTYKNQIRNHISTSSTLWKIGILYTIFHSAGNTIEDFMNDQKTLLSNLLWLSARIVIVFVVIALIFLCEKHRTQNNQRVALWLEFFIQVSGACLALAIAILKLKKLGGNLQLEGREITISSFMLAFDYLVITILAILLFENIYGISLYIFILFGGLSGVAFYNHDIAGGIKLLSQTIFLLILILYVEKMKRNFLLENKKLKVEDKFHHTILDSLPESILVVFEGGIIKFQNDHMKKVFCWDLHSEMPEFYSCFSDFKFRGYDEEGPESPRHPIFWKETAQGIPSFELQVIQNEFKNKISKVETIQHAMNVFQNYTKQWTKFQGNTFIFDCKYKHPLDDNALSIQIKAFILNEDDQAQLTFIFQDTTSRDRIAALQSENEVYRNNIIASFSHELRTPLHSNMGLLEQGLLCADVTKEMREEIIEPALASAKLLLHVINDILDYSQLLNGNFQLNIQPESITKTINSCLTLVKKRMEAKNLQLKVKIYEEKNWLLNTDHNRLSQIFINLLNNAVKFTFEGAITIDFAKHDNDCYRLSVIDTGIGMNDYIQEKLRHNMANNKDMQATLSSDSAGIGLGLFMSNACCRLMSPDFLPGVQFESEKNKGSSFYFYIKDFSLKESSELNSRSAIRTKTFPADINETEGDSPIGSLVKGHATKTMRNKLLQSSMASIYNIGNPEKSLPILLVDDEVFNLMILEKLCSTIDLPVEKAFNGKQALEKVQEIYKKGSEIRFIFMDVNMPIMDGYETTKRLKNMVEQKQIQDLIIVGVTAYVSQEKIAKCYECGMDEVVHKPLSHADFLRVMKKYGFN